MGKSKKQRSPSPEWKNLEAQCLWPEQIAYEIIRPCQLEKQSIKQRAVEVGLHPRTIARKLERFQQLGLPGLLPDSPDDTVDRRRLPLEVREEILRLKAEYPAFIAHEIAVICDIRWSSRERSPSRPECPEYLSASLPARASVSSLSRGRGLGTAAPHDHSVAF